MPDWLDGNRAASLAAAVAAIALSLLLGRDVWIGALVVEVFLLACIWFGEEMGSTTGLLSRMPITERTPGCFVRTIGWSIQIALLALMVFALARKSR
jgi:hypothetical protein